MIILIFDMYSWYKYGVEWRNDEFRRRNLQKMTISPPKISKNDDFATENIQKWRKAVAKIIKKWRFSPSKNDEKRWRKSSKNDDFRLPNFDESGGETHQKMKIFALKIVTVMRRSTHAMEKPLKKWWFSPSKFERIDTLKAKWGIIIQWYDKMRNLWSDIHYKWKQSWLHLTR